MKGNRHEIIHLTEVKHQTERALVNAQAHATENAEAAQPWIASHMELLDGINAALAVENCQEVEDGALVQPSSGTVVTRRS